jgi:hypothetical protein
MSSPHAFYEARPWTRQYHAAQLETPATPEFDSLPALLTDSATRFGAQKAFTHLYRQRHERPHELRRGRGGI